MKPPYMIPTLKYIEAMPWNGLTVASLFAGGGGSCTGYRMAGYRVLYANEFISAAADTYEANHPSTALDRRDIRTINGSDIRDMVGDVDLLDGSPPCAAFSTAGLRESAWGVQKEYSGTVQRVDDLFFEYARILDELRPKVFVAENVSGLVKGVSKGYFIAIIRALRETGYNIVAKLLNALWLGVPQSRERIIFIGVRSDLGKAPVFPDPLPYYYTVRDALEGCQEQPRRLIDQGTKTENLYWHTPRGKYLSEAALRLYGEPNSWHAHSRLAWSKYCPTVLQGSASIYHPDECRTMTIAELKRLCSFPDDYRLTGSYQEQWERLGRSVPPLMMKAISETIRDKVL